jgi:hypothetical protein
VESAPPLKATAKGSGGSKAAIAASKRRAMPDYPAQPQRDSAFVSLKRP